VLLFPRPSSPDCRRIRCARERPVIGMDERDARAQGGIRGAFENGCLQVRSLKRPPKEQGAYTTSSHEFGVDSLIHGSSRSFESTLCFSDTTRRVPRDLRHQRKARRQSWPRGITDGLQHSQHDVPVSVKKAPLWRRTRAGKQADNMLRSTRASLAVQGSPWKQTRKSLEIRGSPRSHEGVLGSIRRTLGSSRESLEIRGHPPQCGGGRRRPCRSTSLLRCL